MISSIALSTLIPSLTDILNALMNLFSFAKFFNVFSSSCCIKSILFCNMKQGNSSESESLQSITFIYLFFNSKISFNVSSFVLSHINISPFEFFPIVLILISSLFEIAHKPILYFLSSIVTFLNPIWEKELGL